METVRAFQSCINKYGQTFIVTLDLGNIAVRHVIPCLFPMLVTVIKCIFGPDRDQPASKQ